MTVVTGNKGDVAPLASAITSAPRRLEFGNPEFVDTEEYFVLAGLDMPCRVTFSIWSHAIFKTSAVSASIQRLPPDMADEVSEGAWLVPSKTGGMREQEHLELSAPRRIDREVTELLKAVDDKKTTQMMLALLALCVVSCFNEIAALELGRLPLWPLSALSSSASRWAVPVTLRGMAAAGALLWCVQHPHLVSEQVLTWQQDWLNYNKVVRQAERARELSDKIKTKGIWGKMKLVHSEYMRTLHEHNTQLESDLIQQHDTHAPASPASEQPAAVEEDAH